MYVYSYGQLVAIVNQQAATIAQHAAVINNLQSERQWLEEDNHIQREELEKSQKNLKDVETSRNFKENTLKKELARLKSSQDDIKWRHKNAVRELNDFKKRNLKLKAQCTSLLDKLDQSTQELQQKNEELDVAKEELDLGYSVGEWMYQHLRYYYWGYVELLKYFQWPPGPSSGGATITELDANNRPVEGKTVAVLPHSYSVTQGVLVSPKPPNSERVTTVLDGANKITAAVNMVKEKDFPTSLIAESVIELVPSTIVCLKTVFVIRLAPSQGQNLIEFLSPLINNTNSWSIPEAPEGAQLSAVYGEVPIRLGNHLQQLAICAPEWVNAPTKIPRLAVKGAGRAPRAQKKKRSNATTLTNITSHNKAFESSSLKIKEKHERGNDERKAGHCQPFTSSSEPDRLSLAKNRQSVDSSDGEKEVLTRKEERRPTGEKKPKTLVSWLKKYRY